MTEEPLPPIYNDTAKFNWKLPVGVALAIVLVVVAASVWLDSGTVEAPTVAIPDELPSMDDSARAYVGQIEITDLQPSKWENMLGQEVVYLDGRLTNNGDRNIAALELTIEFQDMYGQMVRRDTFRAIGGSSAVGQASVLAPNQSHTFRAAFESVPRGWNQVTPTVRITGLLLD
jgi:hypothetical protein